jgi:hypothetical protein
MKFLHIRKPVEETREIILSRHLKPFGDVFYLLGTELSDAYQSKKIRIYEVKISGAGVKYVKKEGIFSVKEFKKDIEATLEDENGKEISLPLNKFYFAVAR